MQQNMLLQTFLLGLPPNPINNLYIHFYELTDTDLHFPLSQSGGFAQFLYSKRTHRLNLHPKVDICRRGRVQVGSAKSIDIRRVVVSLEGIHPPQDQHDDLKGNPLVTSEV